MKLLTALLLVAACHAEVARSKQKEDSRTERRAEDSAVQKRAPAILPTVSPATPGIEYADAKDSQTEKSPVRQIYSQPLSQVAKISDVLTGQGPTFPAAIASHLFSPIPVYQPRLSSPTTYEISAPIPSQLAYSEHKITYQPQQNAIQYAPQEYNQKLPNPKQAIARLTVNYQPYPQQLPQPIVYQPQPIQQFPVYQQTFNQPIQYQQAPVPQYQGQYQQPLIQLVQAQPGIAYAEEEQQQEQHQRPAQRELKTGQPQAVQAAEERAKPQPQQNYIAQPQGAISYASFSVGAPTANYVQPQQQQYQPQQQQQQQHQLQQQQLQQQQSPQQQLQQQHYQQQQQSQQQQQQYQPQPIQLQAIQYQPQSQYHVQQLLPAPQRQIIAKPEQNLIPVPTKQRQIFIRQGPVVVPYQPQAYQGQAPAYQAAAPQFPPVQYFGKFAHSIFGQYQ